MNWHTRYAQQASWTRSLRSYIFEKIDLKNAGRVLEVGCGTGAILSELPSQPQIHGLDIDLSALIECSVHAPTASRVLGNALSLPYPDGTFDVVYSHFLLLWIKDPRRALQEMKRLTRTNGSLIAFAEPDYYERVDEPKELIPLGRWQTESLIRQGADPGLGAHLAELFFEAGIPIVETGMIQSSTYEPSLVDWKVEWDVLESDLHGWVPERDIRQMKTLDQAARESGKRVLSVPTYFAWGRV
jgi:ubiquinone/menaquinone biosynthesis C-methylase UbiE